MAFIELDDSTSTADVTIFPKLWKRISEEITTGALILMDARVEQEQPVIKLIADNVQIYKEQ